MHDPYEFPTDFTDTGEARSLKWTATIIGLATLGLGLLNPGAIDAWVNDLPPGPVTARLAEATDRWQATANHIGLGAGHAELHAAWKTAERSDWSGRQPVETADASNPKS